MTFKLLLSLVGSALVLAACAHGNGGSAAKVAEQSRLGWHPVADGDLSVLMPEGVTREEKVADTAQGPVRIHIAQSSPPGSGESFLVSFAEVPAAVLEKASAPALLDGLQSGTLREVGGNLVSSHDIQAAGMPGREFEAKKPGAGSVRGRVFVGEKGVYTLVATYWGDKVPEDVDRFLSSLAPRSNVAAATGGGHQAPEENAAGR